MPPLSIMRLRVCDLLVLISRILLVWERRNLISMLASNALLVPLNMVGKKIGLEI